MIKKHLAKMLCLAAAFAFLSSMFLPALSISAGKSLKVEFVSPSPGEEIDSELVIQIGVSMDNEKLDDSSTDWSVEFYACGKKVVEGNSIDEVYRVSAAELKPGRCLVVANVMDGKHNLGIAHRYVTILEDNE